MYRTVEINYLPDSDKSWETFTNSRKEAARLWTDLVIRHHRIRRLHWKWPTKPQWFKWAKGKYSNLHCQSVQQIITEFCEALNAITALKKIEHSEAKYPWKQTKFRDVIYTNQGARIRKNYLILPNGKSGTLAIRLSKKLNSSGRLMEARLKFGKILLTYKIIEEEIKESEPVQIGVDLGVNTLIAATDGQKAILISGREIKATIQFRNKKLASIQSLQASRIRRSRRWKKLQTRKFKMLTKSHNKIKDIVHKATRKVVNEFPNAQAFVGEPFNGAAKKMGRIQAQQVSSACTRKVINQLDYKLSGGAIEVNESYSSQTCPVCGCRNKCRRIYKCSQCKFTVPRDVIGSTNILSIGQNKKMVLNQSVSTEIKWVHPIKYPGFLQVVPVDLRQVAQFKNELRKPS